MKRPALGGAGQATRRQATVIWNIACYRSITKKARPPADISSRPSASVACTAGQVAYANGRKTQPKERTSTDAGTAAEALTIGRTSARGTQARRRCAGCRAIAAPETCAGQVVQTRVAKAYSHPGGCIPPTVEALSRYLGATVATEGRGSSGHCTRVVKRSRRCNY